MIGVVFATHREARPFLARSGAKAVASAPFALYRLDTLPVWVAVSGMGKVSAALAVQMLIRERHCRRILNAGICGALVDRHDLAPGNVFRISAVSEGQPGPGTPSDAALCSGDLWQELPQARLVTVEQPVFDPNVRRRLAAWGELVDMEGAVIAWVAHLYGVPWDIIKGITDMAGHGGQAHLHDNLATVSENIAEHLNNGLSNYAASKRRDSRS